MEANITTQIEPAPFAFNGLPIVINRWLIKGHTDRPARPNKRKRIQKKWLKLYGYQEIPDDNIYVMTIPEILPGVPTLEAGKRAIVMHPATFRKFVKAFGSREKAAEGINKYISRVTIKNLEEKAGGGETNAEN